MSTCLSCTNYAEIIPGHLIVEMPIVFIVQKQCSTVHKTQYEYATQQYLRKDCLVNNHGSQNYT